jgi:hypothetical protein
MEQEKAAHCGRRALGEEKLSGGRLGFGRGFGLDLGFGGGFLTLQISVPPFPFLTLIVLLAHKTLYIPNAFRLFSAL